MALDIDMAEIYTAYSIATGRENRISEALDYALKIIEEDQDQDSFHYINALTLICDYHQKLGEIEEAVKIGELAYTKARNRFYQVAEGEYDTLLFLSACLHLGILYRRLSRIEEARDLFVSTYADLKTVPAIFQDDIDFIAVRKSVCEMLTDLYMGERRLKEAFSYCLENHQLATEIYRRDCNNPYSMHGLATAKILLGEYYALSGETENALSAYQEVETFLQKVDRENEESMSLVLLLSMVYERLGTVYRLLSNYSQAENCFYKRYDTLLLVAKATPGNFGLQIEQSTSLQLIGNILYEQKKYAESLVKFDECLSLLMKLAKADPHYDDLSTMIISCYRHKAVINLELENITEAKANYKSLFSYAEENSSLYGLSIRFKKMMAEACIQYGVFLHNELREFAANDYLAKAYSIYTELSEEHPEVAEYQQKVAFVKDLLFQLTDRQ